MGAIAAYQSLLKISTNTVAQVAEVDADFENQMEEVTVMGNRARQYLPTVYKGTIKAKVYYDMTDTNGQLAMQQAFFASPPTLLTMTFSPANSATNTTYSLTCYVAKLAIKSPVDKVVTDDVELQPTSAITFA